MTNFLTLAGILMFGKLKAAQSRTKARVETQFCNLFPYVKLKVTHALPNMASNKNLNNVHSAMA